MSSQWRVERFIKDELIASTVVTADSSIQAQAEARLTYSEDQIKRLGEVPSTIAVMQIEPNEPPPDATDLVKAKFLFRRAAEFAYQRLMTRDEEVEAMKAMGDFISDDMFDQLLEWAKNQRPKDSLHQLFGEMKLAMTEPGHAKVNKDGEVEIHIPSRNH